MLKVRLLNIVLGAALVTQASLTVQEALATRRVVSAGAAKPAAALLSQPAENPAFSQCPWSEAELRSMRLVYVKEYKRWELSIDNSPLGVNGGLMALRNCPPLKW
jgi:hypothetical protein